MTRRSGLLAALLALLTIFTMLAATGCTAGVQPYKSGSDVWTWENKNGTQQITLNGKPFAVVRNGAAQVSMPNGKSFLVTLDSSGEPVSVKASWGVEVTSQDYATMSTAFNVHNWVGGNGGSGKPAGVIILLLLIIGGVLLFICAPQLVNSWKLGGVFGSHETAKSLLIFKALGILVMVVSAIILLVVIFR